MKIDYKGKPTPVMLTHIVDKQVKFQNGSEATAFNERNAQSQLNAVALLPFWNLSRLPRSSSR